MLRAPTHDPEFTLGFLALGVCTHVSARQAPVGRVSGVAVVGDLPFATLSPRAITQVHLPARHLGTTAANMLLERIAGDAQPARTVVLRAEVTQGLAPASAS